MAMIGDITRFEYSSPRETYCRGILNQCFGDNASPDLYKLDLILSNTCFMQAIECFLYGQFDGTILMLRNSIDSALFHAYCYTPTRWENRVAMSYTPNTEYQGYAGGAYWDRNGYKRAIEFLGLNSDEADILSLIDRLDFSAHIAERNARELTSWVTLTQEEKDARRWRIRMLADETDAKNDIEKTVEYLLKIRDAYFTKFPPQ